VLRFADDLRLETVSLREWIRLPDAAQIIRLRAEIREFLAARAGVPQ
jgi:hypothetical protein